MAGLRVHFVMPVELVERIDAALPVGVSRGEFVRWAVERALSEAKEPVASQQADRGSVPSSEGVRSAAPAEQPGPYRPQPGPNVENLRSSAQAKRDVRPIPKGGR